MKRLLALTLALLTLLSCVTVLPTAAASETGAEVFNDISKSWAKDNILWAYENKIANGVSANAFAPGDSLTRGMFVTFLYRAARFAGLDTDISDAENPFADATTGAWYYTPAVWAFENGIITGTGTVGGKPMLSDNVKISRQETAAMLARFLTEYHGAQIFSKSSPTFKDADAIAAWAKDAVTTVSSVGLFKGNAAGNFDATGKTDRASAVTLCRRVYDLLRPTEENEPVLPNTAFSPLTFNLDSLNQQSLTTGRIRFTATLQENSSLVLKTPDAVDTALKEINALSYFTVDGKEHTYDIIWLENNAVLFFCDGERVFVLGRDRTYSMEVDEETVTIGKEYQSPSEPVTETTVFCDGIEMENPCMYRLIDESPLGLHGTLSVDGNKLIDKFGEETVMNGMHLFIDGGYSLSSYFNYEGIKWMRDDWGINCFRLALIPAHYLTEPEEKQESDLQLIYGLIEAAKQAGVYILLDWHGYEEYPSADQPDYIKADPRIYEEQAAEFFDHFSEKYADYNNIFYELYNEPTGGKGFGDLFSWDEVTKSGITYLKGYEYTWNEVMKPYSEHMIDTIRANDPDSVIVVNTPEADQHPEVAALFPFDYDNLMYAVHPWSDGGMKEITTNRTLAARRKGICIFATECGFYPDEAGGFEEFGLEETIENGIYWLHSNQEEYLETFIEKYNINYIYFLLGLGYDDDQRMSLNRDKICYEQMSGWTDEQLTYTGEYMRHWFRKRAGLEDNSWFENWHTENDEKYAEIDKLVHGG